MRSEQGQCAERVIIAMAAIGQKDTFGSGGVPCLELCNNRNADDVRGQATRITPDKAR